MKKIKKTIEIEQWIDKCPHCDKVIEGRTRDQVIWNLSVHITSQHKGLLKKKTRGKDARTNSV